MKTKARKFKSPIETKLRNAICHLVEENAELSLYLTDYSTSPERLILEEQDGKLTLSNECPPVDDSYQSWGDGDHYFTLYSNVSIASYRVDFLLTAEGMMLAIECDGHDFHDRTKQQASADRARDRDLLRRGLHVIRFTGSDITYNGERCAAEIFEIARTLKGRADAVDNRAIDAYIEGVAKGQSEGRETGHHVERVFQETRGIYAGILSGVG